jgi:hypothetical protein
MAELIKTKTVHGTPVEIEYAVAPGPNTVPTHLMVSVPGSSDIRTTVAASSLIRPDGTLPPELEAMVFGTLILKKEVEPKPKKEKPLETTLND